MAERRSGAGGVGAVGAVRPVGLANAAGQPEAGRAVGMAQIDRILTNRMGIVASEV
ncbi:hypothetical protein SPHINGO391_440094 [Sphingomonas aurantiaca]|uniref:Uncharacterized protein n=1 Tax=Sphingomonas aurantiaca TaxID=185949 RepID=A0A5E7Z7I6_9SPHN|nr:hypothetical protein SPHINGO391_440094 [Sphingomonas aurantiaca]